MPLPAQLSPRPPVLQGPVSLPLAGEAPEARLRNLSGGRGEEVAEL